MPRKSNSPAGETKFPSELRLDLVSKDWIVVATGRARRPETFRKKSRVFPLEWSKAKCPFENLDDQEHPTHAYYKGKEINISSKTAPKLWTTLSLPNKYPAFFPSKSMKTRLIGPYQVMDGVGFHEVILTRDHKRDIPEFSLSEVAELIDIYHARYVDLMNKEFVNYISIFKNKGPEAGATVAHPHSQLIATPITDPDIEKSLAGSREFFESRQECVHCLMLEWDMKDGKRIIFENDCAVAVCPFASVVAFEIRIFPKKHLSYFERITDHQKKCLAEAFSQVMKMLYKALKDPDYNYFLHTAPVDNKDYSYYHWHWEILPKTTTWAGFEIGTGIEISTIEPERAAEFLKKQ